MYEETLIGWPHDTSVQKATSDKMKMWIQFNVDETNYQVYCTLANTINDCYTCTLAYACTVLS